MSDQLTREMIEEDVRGFLDKFKAAVGRVKGSGEGGTEEEGGDEDDKSPDVEKMGIKKGDSYVYTSKTGNKSAVMVADPENENGVTVAVKIDPNTCAPKGGSQFTTKPEAFVDNAGKPIDKCSGEQGAKRAASAPGKKTPVSVVRPGQKGETSLAQYFQQAGLDKASAVAIAQQVAKYLGGKKIPVAEVATMLHEQEQVQKGKSYLYTTDTGKNKGKKTPVVVLDPKNQNNATYVRRLNPDSCEPISGAEFAQALTNFQIDQSRTINAIL
jgi:hypothetical protein